ncbi:pentapeptide repeat-containing protein [Paraburkholderia phymatum]|uniref:Pentapeptide repeat-containing protein n=1 Tax=Paraburkholderia phymatum TaxID=148447 RepID=A0ACC6UE27_9BURK
MEKKRVWTERENKKTAIQKSAEEAIRPMLESANSASSRVAVLHITLMITCSYLLIVTLSTTDLNLLIGGGIRLPVVDVEVPITAFFVLAPLLVILVHFNFLLQLQLLSRKLFVFDKTVQEYTQRFRTKLQKDDSKTYKFYDQLDIFPYSWYLVAPSGQSIRALLACMVTVTILLLPLITILAIALRFLCYQSEAITWSHRLAIWIDCAVILSLWPVIMDPQDDWKAFHRRAAASLKNPKSLWLLSGLMFTVLTIYFSQNQSQLPWDWQLELIVAVFIFSVFYLVYVVVNALFYILRRLRKKTKTWRADAQRSATTVLSTRGVVPYIVSMLVILPMPLALTVDGEELETSVFGQTFFNRSLHRNFELSDAVVEAKPVAPDTIAEAKEEDIVDVHDLVGHVSPVNLEGRKLRHAVFKRAFLVGANLQHADLSGAILSDAILIGANLVAANGSEADFRFARVDGASFNDSVLAGDNFKWAKARGADFTGAALEMAHFADADLRVALFAGNMTGTVFDNSELSGASFETALLQGASFGGANLTGATIDILDWGGLYSPYYIDVRFLKSSVLDSRSGAELSRIAKMTVPRHAVGGILEKIDKAVGHPAVFPFDYCLYGSPISSSVACKHRFSQDSSEEQDEFARGISATFKRMVCDDRATARNFSYRVRSTLLAHEARTWFMSPDCLGAMELTADERNEELGVLEIVDPLKGTERPRVNSDVYISKELDWFP